jgi:dTDP-4-dehydrorhamnose reductase
MRIYVIGSEGQIARSLRDAPRRNDVVLSCSSRPQVNILRPESVESAIEEFSPDVVVNPAAYTAVDRAEADSDLAFSINRDGAASVATAARRLGIPIIHLSTDYVFDGKKASPYTETDAVAPQGVYGQSKLAGELAVSAANERNIILRTSWVYAPFGNNFVRTMLRLGSERDRVRVIDDQIGCPTYAPDIAHAIIAIADLVEASGWRPDYAGVTHLAGPDELTWFGFAQAIMRLVKAKGGRAADVEPISTTEYPTAAVRPANSRLNCDRLYSIFNVRLPRFSRSIAACIEQLLDNSRQPAE